MRDGLVALWFALSTKQHLRRALRLVQFILSLDTLPSIGRHGWEVIGHGREGPLTSRAFHPGRTQNISPRSWKPLVPLGLCLFVDLEPVALFALVICALYHNPQPQLIAQHPCLSESQTSETPVPALSPTQQPDWQSLTRRTNTL